MKKHVHPHAFSIRPSEKYSILFLLICAVLLSATSVFAQDSKSDKAILSIEKNEADNTPKSISFLKSAALRSQDAQQLFKKYLGLDGTANILVLNNTTQTKQQTTIDRYVQYYKGIKVASGNYTIMSKDGIVQFMTGNFYNPGNTLPTNPAIDEHTALENALKNTAAQKYMWEEPGMERLLKEQSKKEDTSYYPKGTLVWIEDILGGAKDRKLHLAYVFDIYAITPVSRELVYVDAQTGKILFVNALLENTAGSGPSLYSGAVSFETALAAGTYTLHDATRGGGINTYSYGGGPGTSILEVSSSSSTWTTDAALDAHWGAEKVYDYWMAVQGRNSIDNAGMPINSYTHYLSGYNNAYWDGSKMVYGDGSGIASGGFSPLVALDVCAHEIGHGICQHTAGLVYSKESGAMNEGFSDIWGAIVENYSDPHEVDAVAKSMWKIGEEISASSLRRMDDPNLKTQPDTYGGAYWYNVSGCAPSASNDYCGVHTNSGVMNYWFYLVTTGGSGTNDIGNAFSVAGIGSVEAANITYQTELVLAGTATFSDCRTASINVATTLYGPCSPEVKAVTKAWYAVGVGGDYTGSVVGAITGPATVCAGSSITLADPATGGVWSSSAAVATVGASTGLVAGVSGGTTTISYSIGLCSATKTVTVYPTSAGTISGSLSVCAGASVTLTSAAPWGTWSSSVGSVASVGTDGVATGISSGTSVITYTITNTCGTSYTVMNMTVNPSPAAITGPSSACVAGTITPGSAPSGGTWISGSPSIASIGISSGLVTGIAPGTALISYTAGLCTVSKIITVDILSAGVITGPSSVSPGSSIAFASTAGGGSWNSSNPLAITIGASSGSATGVAPGTTVISYTVTNSCGASTATKTVTVACPTGTSIVTTILGTGTAGAGATGGLGTATAVNLPWGVGADATGNVYVCDFGNNRVLKVSITGIVTSFAGTGVAGFFGDGGPATAAKLSEPTGLAVYGTDVYVVDLGNGRVRKINAAGIISTVAGNGAGGYSGDGGPATLAQISSPNGLCADAAGNLYIPDQYTNRIRKVNAAGIISTVAGNGSYGYAGDGGPATAAQMKQPNGVTVDNAGNLYIAEYAGSRIRKVTPAGIITTYAGNGTTGFFGDGGLSTLSIINGPAGMDVDNSGNLLICDFDNQRVRQVNAATGIITTYAGIGTAGFSGDGLAPALTQFNGPGRINCDASGNIYITDFYNHRVRKISVGAAAISGLTNLCQNATIALTATPAGGTWTSGNPAVAAIGASSGIVTGISAGTAVISYLPAVGCVTFITITVNASPSVTPSPLALCVGSTSTLTSTSPAGTWISGSLGVATIAPSSGFISALAAGTSAITYTISTGCKTITIVSVETTVAIHPVHLPTNGLIAWYPFNGNAHNEWAYDEFGAGKNGRPVGPILSVDRFGNANSSYHFNGISDHINIDSAFFNIGWPDYTISAWVYADALTNPNNAASSLTLINSVPHNGLAMSLSWLASGKYSIWANSNPTSISWDMLYNRLSVTPITVGAWRHVAMVKNGPVSFSLYVNGLLENTFTSAVPAVSYYTKMCLGHIDTTVYTNEGFLGKTDDYAIWRRGLSSSEVFNVYNGDSSSLSICIGSNVTLYYTPLGGTWSSSNGTIASVDASGVITGIAVGTATITYTKSNGCGSAIATRVVTVNPIGAGPITGPPSVCAGLTIPLAGSVSGGTWSSSASGTATVGSSTGIVTGVSPGTVIISYTTVFSCGTSLATTVVTVNPQPVAGVITGTTTLCEGSYTFLNDTLAGGIWTCAPSTVAAVSMTGVVTGVGGGTAIVTYSIVNACGAALALKAVTVNPLPNAGVITGISSVCVGAGTLLSDVSPGGVWSVDLPGIATVSATGAVLGVGAGTAWVSYSVTNSCGTTRATRVVTVNPMPNAGTITGAASVCVGAGTMFTDIVTGGVWSSSSVAATVSSVGLVTGSAAGTLIISYTVSNVCGTNFATKAITVNPLPDAGSITGSGTVCQGSTILLTNPATGGTWSCGPFSIASVNITGLVTGNSPGTAIVSYLVSNGCGTAYATKTITVNPPPDAGTIIGATSVCAGNTIPLTNLATGGVWTSGTASVASIDAAGLVTGHIAGTSTVSYTVTNSCGTAVAQRIVTVNPMPDAGIITGITTACIGITTLFTNTVTGGVWTSSAIGVASVSSTGSVTAISNGIANISYAITNACGSAYTTRTITVSPLPDAGSITGFPLVCAGNFITLGSTVSGGTWSVAPGGIITVTGTGTVTGINAGTSAVTYTVANGCGTAISTVSVTVIPLPVAGSITGVPVVCVGYTTLFSDTATGGSWTSNMPGVATVSSSGLVLGISSGTAIMTYSQVNSCGTAFAVKTATVNPLPDAGVITGAVSVCVGAVTMFSNSITSGVWSSSSGAVTITGAGLVTGTAVGTSIISYTVSNACGAGYATKTITVNPLPDAGAISGGATVCETATTLLTDLATGGTWVCNPLSVASINTLGLVTGNSPGTAIVSYTVSNGCGAAYAAKTITVNPLPAAGTITGVASLCAGSTIALINPATGGAWTSGTASVASVDATGQVTGHIAGTSAVSYTVTNGCGTAIAQRIVTVNPIPDAGIITGLNTACAGLTTPFTNTVTGGVWTSSAVAIASVGATGSVSAISSGVAVISYAITNSCGIAYTTSAITVNPLPDAGSITGSPVVCEGSVTILSSTAPGGTWNVGAGGIITVTGSATVSGISAGLGSVTYTVSNGCGTAISTTSVTVNPLPVVGAITGTPVVCVGYTTLFNDAAPGGSWTSNLTAVATVNSAGVVTGINTGTSVISYVVSNGCGAAISTRIVSVDVLPDPGTISGPSALCIYSTASLANTVTGGTWAVGSGAVAAISGSGVVSGLSVGTTVVSYTVTGMCSSVAATKIISVITIPDPGILTGVPTICQGYTTALAAPVAGGLWTSSNSGVAAIAFAPGVITGVHPGTAVISYIMSNSCGTAIAQQVVTVNAWPDAGSITGPVIVCQGANIPLTDLVSGGAWTSATLGIATVGSTGIVTGVGAGTAVISYAFTNACGTSVANRIITVKPLPDPGTVFGASSVCAGAAIVAGDVVPGGAWSCSPASVIAIGATGIVTGINAGTGVVSYSVTNDCGTVPALKTITVNPLPDAGFISGSGNVCNGASVSLIDAMPGGVWSATPGGHLAVTSIGAVSGLSVGTSYVTYTVTNGCGIAYALKTMTVNPLPDAGSVTGASSICQGANLMLTEIVSGGAWSSSNTTVATVSSAGFVTANAPGIVSILYSVTNSCGTIAATHEMTINPQPYAGTINGNTAICPGATVSLTNSALGGVWSSAIPVVATVTGSGVVNALGAGIVTISYTVTNSCGTVAATSEVTVNPLPDAGLIYGQKALCAGTTGLLHDAVADGIWSANNTGILSVANSTAGTATVTAIAAGIMTVSYATSNSCGSALATVLVTVNALPDAGTVSGAATVKTGATTPFTDQVPGGIWISNPKNVASIDSNGIVTGIAAGTALITYAVSNDCGTTILTAQITVQHDEMPIEFMVYPNPTQGNFIVQSPVAGVFIVYTMEGKELQRYGVIAGINQLTLPPHIAAATYMCRFVGADGTTKGLKLIFGN